MTGVQENRVIGHNMSYKILDDNDDSKLEGETIPFAYSKYPELDSERHYVLQEHWRHKSVTDRTPIIIRDENGNIYVVPIAYLWYIAE